MPTVFVWNDIRCPIEFADNLEWIDAAVTKNNEKHERILWDCFDIENQLKVLFSLLVKEHISEPIFRIYIFVNREEFVGGTQFLIKFTLFIRHIVSNFEPVFRQFGVSETFIRDDWKQLILEVHNAATRIESGFKAVFPNKRLFDYLKVSVPWESR